MVDTECTFRFRRSGVWLATALLVIPYAAIVGGGPPVVRASVLVLMTLLGIGGIAFGVGHQSPGCFRIGRAGDQSQ